MNFDRPLGRSAATVSAYNPDPVEGSRHKVFCFFSSIRKEGFGSLGKEQTEFDESKRKSEKAEDNDTDILIDWILNQVQDDNNQIYCKII